LQGQVVSDRRRSAQADAKQQQQAIAWIRSGEKTQSEVAEFFDLDRSTVSRMMSEVRVKEQNKAGLL